MWSLSSSEAPLNKDHLEVLVLHHPSDSAFFAVLGCIVRPASVFASDFISVHRELRALELDFGRKSSVLSQRAFRCLLLVALARDCHVVSIDWGCFNLEGDCHVVVVSWNVYASLRGTTCTNVLVLLRSIVQCFGLSLFY
jgi:hypothetical protein